MSKTSNILNILPKMSQFLNSKGIFWVKLKILRISQISCLTWAAAGDRHRCCGEKFQRRRRKKNCRNFRNFSPSSSDSPSRLKEGGGQPSTSKYFQCIHVTVHFLVSTPMKCECFNAFYWHWSVEVGQSRGGRRWKNIDFFVCLCNCSVFFV